MKLAFSTLGCPGWSWDEVFAVAKDLGMDGIEIRGIEDEMFAPATRPFRPENLKATKERLAEAGLAVPMLTSACCLGAGDTAAFVAEAKAYVDLAAQAGARYVRVMCTATPQPAETDLPLAKRLYAELAEYAAGTGDAGVRVLIETNGVLADSSVLKEFLDGIPEGNAGVLWDIHHPYRYFGESPAKTYKNVGRHIRYIHVKDSVMGKNGAEYRMMGYGDVPVYDALSLLEKEGYDGFVSLEWVKRWWPDLEEPGIVFAHYAHYMRFLLERIGG